MFLHSSRLRIITTSLLSLAFCFTIATTQGSAQNYDGPKGPKGGNQGGGAQNLPALPSSAAINNVINASQGPQFTPFGVPSAILNGFSAFQSPFAGLQTSIDTQESVAYINMGNSLLQIAMPLIGAATTALQPNIQTPDGASARVIGGLYEPSSGDNVVVAVFNGGGNHIKELRFYYYNGSSLTYNSVKYKGKKLNGEGGQPSPGDQGAGLANTDVCYTIGLDQVCFSPDPGTRDGSVSGIMQQSYQTISQAYNLGDSFDTGNAVPDLIGHNYRLGCAAAGLNGGACAPNVVYTAAQNPGPNQPIAIFHVMRANDLSTYDTNGNPVAGGLPPGDYAVLNATPGAGVGSVGVLFLVNAASGQANYLIPSLGMEGFGSIQGEAAIKDGSMGGWAW